LIGKGGKGGKRGKRRKGSKGKGRMKVKRRKNKGK